MAWYLGSNRENLNLSCSNFFSSYKESCYEASKLKFCLVTNNSRVSTVSLLSETDLICVSFGHLTGTLFCKRMEPSYMNAIRLETRFFFLFPGRIFKGLNHCFLENVRV